MAGMEQHEGEVQRQGAKLLAFHVKQTRRLGVQVSVSTSVMNESVNRRARMSDEEQANDRVIAAQIREAYGLVDALDDEALIESVRAIRMANGHDARWRAALGSMLGLSLCLTEPSLDDAIEDLLEFIPTQTGPPELP